MPYMSCGQAGRGPPVGVVFTIPMKMELQLPNLLILPLCQCIVFLMNTGLCNCCGLVVDILKAFVHVTCIYRFLCLINCTFTRMGRTIYHVCPLSTCLVMSRAGYVIRLTITNGYGSPFEPRINHRLQE